MAEEIDIFLSAVGLTFPVGTSVGLYRGRADDSGVPRPTGPSIATATVAADETLTFADIPKDQPTFYAAALFGEAWRIVGATTTAGEHPIEKGPVGPEGKQGPQGEKGADGGTAAATEKTRAEAAEALRLLKTSNLSDLASAATARTNLGLGTAATKAEGAFDAAGAATAAQAASQPLDADLTAIAALATQSAGRELLTKSTVALIRAYVEASFADSTLFNVKNPTYGAKGDNATDDATALAAAITAAKAVNGTVYFPAGTYITGTTLVLPSNVRILGAGWTSSTIKAKNASNIVVLEGEGFASTGIVNSAVEQIAIDGNKANNATATHGIKLQAQNVYFNKVLVRNCRGDAFRVVLTTETQQEIAGLDNTFLSCRAIGCEGYGFYINAHDSLLHDCQAIQCKETGFQMVANAYMYYCHSWCFSSGETVTKIGFFLGGDVICVSCVAEGASEKQVQVAGGNNRWIGGDIFDSSGKPNVPLVEFTGEGGSHYLDGVYLHDFGTGGALKFTGSAENTMIRAQIFDPEGKPAGIGTPSVSVMFDVTLGGSTGLGTIPGRFVRREVTLTKRVAGEAPNSTIFVDNTTGLLGFKNSAGTVKTLEPEPEWTKVTTFTNSWGAETNQFKISYRKVGDRVEFQGALKGGTTNLSAFILPAGFRPAKLIILQAWVETVEITTTGEVKPNGSGIAHLTGQSFSTAAEPA